MLLTTSGFITLLASCANVTQDEPKVKSDTVVVSIDNQIPTKETKALSTEYGIASWYSVKTNYGTKTASGRRLYDNAYTAAHKTLPMGSQVRVTNLSNGRSEKLTINDRGPYVRGRIIDVTIGSGKRLGFYSNGITKVKVEVLKRGNWKYQH